VLATVGSAWAQPATPSTVADAGTAEAEARALTHFRSALRLYDATPPDYAGALAEFQAAYRDKASAGTKQNIALCFKALRKYPEAMDALDELVRDHAAQLKPSQREAVEETREQLRMLVATVRVRVTAPHGAKAPEGTVVVVDGEPVPSFAVPLRLGVGVHTFVARAPGFREAPARSVSLEGGQREIDVVVDLWPDASQSGVLVIYREGVNRVRVDGELVTQLPYREALAPGVHVVEFIDADGDRLRRVVRLAPGETVELAAPPPTADLPTYDAPRGTAPVKYRPWFVRGGGAFSVAPLSIAPKLVAPGGDASRAFTGGSFALSLGRRVTDHVAVELSADVGTLSARFQGTSDTGVDATASMDSLVLMPMARFWTSGLVRFTAAAGVGLGARAMSATLASGPGRGRETQRASGINAAASAEAGVMFTWDRTLIQLVGFGDVFGVGAVRDAQEQPFLDSSPAFRAGGRASIGLWF
jgi:hypothetical protein